MIARKVINTVTLLGVMIKPFFEVWSASGSIQKFVFNLIMTI